MKTWERPNVQNLSFELTRNDFEPYKGNGNKLICPVCCKTSNPGANGNHSFHEGDCVHSATNSKDVLVPNDGSVCFSAS